MLKQLEDLEDVKLYDEVKRNNLKSIPLDVAFYEIERQRKKVENGL